MTASRQYAVALIALAAAGAAMLAGLAQVWVRAVAGGGGVPTVTTDLTGRDLVPAAAGAAILILAGVAGVVATSRTARAVVAAVVAVVAVGGAIAVVRFAASAREIGQARVATDLPGVDVAVTTSGWWLITAAGAAIAAIAALVTVARGHRWPSLGGRYQRDPGGSAPRPGSSARPDSLTAAAAWDALDRGEDPTANDLVTEWPDHSDESSPRT